MSLNENIQRRRLTIGGQVQGVGFRPFVYRLACELGLVGWVVNDAQGVTVEVQAGSAQLSEFMRLLTEELPPLAKISRIDEQDIDVDPLCDEFIIKPSSGGELSDAQVTVDTATCQDCLREMRDPADPRYRYPFINCTNCGPRYSIVRKIPYDRPNTTMAEFPMCSLCGSEYADPADRRFHAQPVACQKCGPEVWLVDTHGKQIVASESAIDETAKLLKAGKIVAIKGLGGFHLACRADDDHVVKRLRRKKRRDAKPFAVMVRDIAAAQEICDINEDARKLLTGPICPIVLCPKKAQANIAASVSDGLDSLGVLLPYAPLHHLLFDLGLGPMVMTSGNYSEEPLVKDNDAAVAHLGRIADGILLHNRPIERPMDDSVVQSSGKGRLHVLRRARGYAPMPIKLSGVAQTTPAVLAVGAELKSAVSLLKDDRAVLSEHIGDLKDGRNYRHFIDVINNLEHLFEFSPEAIAADSHPQYLSSEYALKRHRGELAGRAALPVVRVQHHHAHVASCMAENDVSEPVIGLVCDGVGYGDDGAVWGCEVLRADLTDYQRLGHLRYTPLLGGDAAAVETYRPALAVLWDTFGESCADLAILHKMVAEQRSLDTAFEMLSAGFNCPPSSSLGRWFDAVAALCDVAHTNRFEAQAPMLLESAITPGIRSSYDFTLTSSGPFEIDLRPMVEEIVHDITVSTAPGVIAAKFHNTVILFLTAAAIRAREETKISTVALTGGCFANRYLTAGLAAILVADEFTVLLHENVPSNDGGIALGQAVVAAAKIAKSKHPSQKGRKADRI